ncbi:hypothetical protein H4R20_006172 [Coemansia guatemalensis]|uniref:Programmed cell death protein 2 C-terminal domain-containing protein n=1 Tax=Coemansia guatemalensis TaxID=2761395 RepID=A0A9W8HRC1_9FUNG|nr:hypothetical protein H4R20_006172 [Coemansia guatemalensis]
MASNDKRGLPQQSIALGYADENIERADDTDPLASKLGGRPLWLDSTSPIPAQTVAMCDECGSGMLLLTQTYAPLSESPYDRVLYIWSCARRMCIGKPGAMRVIRGHLLNQEYALRLVRQREGDIMKKSRPMDSAQFPQSASGTSKRSDVLFDFGSVWRTNETAHGSAGGDKLFSSPFFSTRTTETTSGANTAAGGDKSADDLDTLSSNMEQLNINSVATVERVDWAQELNTVQARYLAFDEEMDVSSDDVDIVERYRAEIDQALDKAQGVGDYSSHQGSGRSCSGRPARDEEDDGWSGEKYERTPFPKGTDAAFQRFSAVVGRNPEQVMRYQFGGTPLLYALHDEVARLLDCGHDRGYDEDDDDEDDNNNSSNKFSTVSLPKCPRCNGRRVFECQLMPALLTALPFSAHVSVHPAGRDGAQTASTAAGQPLVGSRLLQSLDLGLEFGTMLIFVCENDCHDGKAGTQYLGQSAEAMLPYAGAAYYEELALVQLESHS